MNLAQNLNEVRAITQLADTLHVQLPSDLTAQAHHLQALDTEYRTTIPASTESAAAALVAHLGDPAALAKARKKTATELATADIETRLMAATVDRAAAVLRQRLRQHADAITTAFADAAQPHLETLAEDAATLPEGFKPEDADRLTPEQYAAWSRAKAAVNHLESIRAVLRPLYSTPADDMLTADAVRALTYIEPPELTDPQQAHTFARALAGTRHGGSSIGPVNIDGVFAPTACAHLGATFTWAGTHEVNERAARINAAGVAPIVTREDVRTAKPMRVTVG